MNFARTWRILSGMKHGPYILHEFGVAAEAHYESASGWLTAACATSIPWPEEDVRLLYDGDEYFLRGVRDRGGRRSFPAITMRCKHGRDADVLAKLLRFTSILGWYKRGYVDVGGHVTSSRAVLYSEPNTQTNAGVIAGGPDGFDCNYLPLIRAERVRRALAFWREGCRLRRVHAGYAFLSFFKVLESQFGKSVDRVAWIEAAVDELEGDAALRVQELKCTVRDVGKHIYESGRCAVAHAQYSDGRGDPDVPADRKRLNRDLVVIEALARKYISEELDVPDEMRVYRERNRLEPLASYLGDEVYTALRSGQHVSRRRLGINGIAVGLARWPEAPIHTFAKLQVRVDEVREGWVFASANSERGSVTLSFALDFPSGRAHLDIERTRYSLSNDAAATEDAIALIQLRKFVIGNGRMELWLPNGSRIDFEVLIPVNVDIARTWQNMDVQIQELRRQLESQEIDRCQQGEGRV
jgi:hypothetical protein